LTGVIDPGWWFSRFVRLFVEAVVPRRGDKLQALCFEMRSEVYKLDNFA